MFSLRMWPPERGRPPDLRFSGVGLGMEPPPLKSEDRLAGAPAAETPGVQTTGQREGFLDAIRAIAILRVIAWHAFGAAAITYVVAAMPAMFFVTGSLLAKSFRRRRARTVLADRFRRLLLPLWAFGLVAWGAMAVAAVVGDADLPLRKAVTWLFPLWDPEGSAWEGGWLSSHLWYLRALVWLLLASPLLLWALRASRALAFAVPVAALFALDVASRGDGSLAREADVAWVVGDFALYGVFLMVGFAHRDGAFRAMTPRRWMGVAAVAAVAAAVWRLTQPVPLGVVNNSHPLHLFVGVAWLATGLAAQRGLSALAAGRWTGGLVRAIGRRSLTIYLWHTTAIILAVHLLEARGVVDPLAHGVGLVLLTAIGTIVAARLFGWIEDLAAGRSPALRPATPEQVGRRRAALGVLVALAASVLAFAPAADRGGTKAVAAPRRPPIPSQQPPAPTFDTEPTETVSVVVPVEERPRFAVRLDALLDEWAEDEGISGAVAGVAVGTDHVWTGATGARPDTGIPLSIRDRIDVASVTKLFTASLVYHFADAGLIDLSGPVPPLTALPDFPYEEGITVDQLLEHTSGLVNYQDAQAYIDDPTTIADPVSAVMASVEEGLASTPGEVFGYASTNYLVLGFLLEQVTGRTYDELLFEKLLQPLGLSETVHRPPSPADPRGATAGIETSLGDLMDAGIGILRNHVGMSEAAYAALTDTDVRTRAGRGTFGYCPCRIDKDGIPRFFARGHWGATTAVAYANNLDMTIVVDLAESLWEGGRLEAVESLFELIEAAAAEQG